MRCELRYGLASSVGAHAENPAGKAGAGVPGPTHQLMNVTDNGGICPGVRRRRCTGQGGTLLGGNDEGDNSGTQKVTNIVEVQDLGFPSRFGRREGQGRPFDPWLEGRGR